jgi:lysozyme
MRRINEKGLALIKKFEGLRLEAYRCPAGKLTIGYGSTGSHVKEGMVITEPEAEILLKRDLGRFETGVDAILGPVAATSGQFSALVSFSFNLGLMALHKSTLMKKHRAGDFAGAGDQFRQWNKARVNGHLVPLAGLTARREAERNLYLGKV